MCLSTILATKANISSINRACCLSSLSNQPAMLTKVSLENWIVLGTEMGLLKMVGVVTGTVSEELAPWGTGFEGSASEADGGLEVAGLSMSSSWIPSLSLAR
ncbi:hypothetical protein HAX54_021921 [Datura stramonium]|uniref:Uncharacterized protein n=1 Tax=Datura stramonium TaxID=4076 RepID=A0ABS8UTN4_DATST|nr:hypothetical protein [Datura stramonium]